ncbi:hypothetical protein BGCPKDLD_2915 [Methylorubrum suomiense]|uniref:Uncharacterized protein n=1 Tax=Methylorubrum suomiense TaxID=144191 RepID=A0ABQ4UVI3_9HYPH|nr:hypothetical protein BGCPKDLD_2915 [Methylorubrum suomiense]
MTGSGLDGHPVGQYGGLGRNLRRALRCRAFGRQCEAGFRRIAQACRACSPVGNVGHNRGVLVHGPIGHQSAIRLRRERPVRRVTGTGAGGEFRRCDWPIERVRHRCRPNETGLDTERFCLWAGRDACCRCRRRGLRDLRNGGGSHGGEMCLDADEGDAQLGTRCLGGGIRVPACDRPLNDGSQGGVRRHRRRRRHRCGEGHQFPQVCSDVVGSRHIAGIGGWGGRFQFLRLSGHIRLLGSGTGLESVEHGSEIGRCAPSGLIAGGRTARVGLRTQQGERIQGGHHVGAVHRLPRGRVRVGFSWAQGARARSARARASRARPMAGGSGTARRGGASVAGGSMTLGSGPRI